MIAYHIDRLYSLHEKQIVKPFDYPASNGSFSFMTSKLFDNQLSHHGSLYLHDSQIGNCPNTCSSIIEFNLELVRFSFFRRMPSRFRSFFACKTLEDVEKWVVLLGSKTHRIFEIDIPDNSFAYLDASVLPKAFENMDNLLFSPSLMFESCYRYWSGHSSDTPLMELFTDSEVKILREIT